MRNLQCDRVTPDSELYIAYFKEAEVPEEGGAVLEVLDNSNNVIATLDKANTLYRILDFKVCKLGNRKLLVTTEQGFARWDGVRTQVFDITDNSKLSLKPGDAGYEDFCLFTSPEIGVLNYNRWGNTSVYVDEANNEIYFTSVLSGQLKRVKRIISLQLSDSSR